MGCMIIPGTPGLREVVQLHIKLKEFKMDATGNAPLFPLGKKGLWYEMANMFYATVNTCIFYIICLTMSELRALNCTIYYNVNISGGR